jgi:hypothetical protein
MAHPRCDACRWSNRLSGVSLLTQRCCDSACRGFSLWGHPDSELLHQRHQVPVRPFFGDFGVFGPVDGGAGDGGLPIGRLHAEEGALVSSTGCPVDHDLVAFGDGVVDRKLQVGKAPAAALDVVPYVVRSGGEGGEYGIVETCFHPKR